MASCRQIMRGDIAKWVHEAGLDEPMRDNAENAQHIRACHTRDVAREEGLVRSGGGEGSVRVHCRVQSCRETCSGPCYSFVACWSRLPRPNPALHASPDPRPPWLRDLRAFAPPKLLLRPHLEQEPEPPWWPGPPPSSPTLSAGGRCGARP